MQISKRHVKEQRSDTQPEGRERKRAMYSLLFTDAVTMNWLHAADDDEDALFSRAHSLLSPAPHEHHGGA